MFSLIPLPIRFALVAGIAIIGGLSSWWVTSTYYHSKILSMQNMQQEAVIKAEGDARFQQAAADKVTHDRDVANVTAHQRITIVHDTVTKRIPFYVSPATDRRFPLSCGFIRLHNAYAAGSPDPSAVPLPSGALDTDQCDVTESSAVQVIGDNYALALGWKADLETWEGWYQDQLKVWNQYLQRSGVSTGGGAAGAGVYSGATSGGRPD